MQARTLLNRHRLTEWGVPALILALPIFGVFWFDALGALLLALVAFGIGLFLRPKHLWIIWIEAILLWWLAGGAWSQWGEDAAAGEAEETVFSFMIETIPFTALLVLLPMFLGRLIPAVSGLLRDSDRELGQR
jgi:hypothetical protein